MKIQQKITVYTQLDAIYRSLNQAERLEWLYNYTEKAAGSEALLQSNFKEIQDYIWQCDDGSIFDEGDRKAYDNIQDFYRAVPDARPKLSDLEPDYDAINDAIKLTGAI